MDESFAGMGGNGNTIAGMGGDGNAICGDGRGWKQNLRGWAGMGFKSVPVQVSTSCVFPHTLAYKPMHL